MNIHNLIKQAYLAGYFKGEKCEWIKPISAKNSMANDYARKQTMRYEQKNTILVTFIDGSTLESKGSPSGIEEYDLQDDLKWISSTLPSYIRDKEKTMNDVKSIEIVLQYDSN